MKKKSNARIIYLTSGAGGMFCGSCMHDNALAKSLSRAGWDIRLVPTYTPIRTDETDVSVDQVFFGGINVFLQQKLPLLRYVPAFLDRFLDNPWLIRRVTSRAMDTDLQTLGKLAVSMLKGTKGNQRKEVIRMCRWLEQTGQPDLLIFTNILIGGCIPEFKRRLNLPVLVTLQGDDVFLDSLPPPHKKACIDQIQKIAQQVDGFLVHSQFYKTYMSQYLSLDESKIHVTPLGLDIDDFAKLAPLQNVTPNAPTIGYLARLAPEKGLHHLIDGFIHLKKSFDCPNVKLKIAGWLGPQNQEYSEQQFAKLADAGLEGHYEYVGSIERREKLQFLQSLDLLSVPTEFLEPKGLYILEALAAGVPVVQPDHGAFPELIQESRGGLLVPPFNPEKLAHRWHELLQDPQRRQQLGEQGRQYVLNQRNGEAMAGATAEVIRQHLP